MIKMKIMGALALLAMGLVSTGVASAADLNIAVVNVQRLLEESPQAKSALSRLQEEFAVRQQQITQEEEALAARVEEVRNNLAVMGEAEQDSAKRELRDKQLALAKNQSDYLKELDTRRTEELNRLQRSLLEEVQSYARTNNYDLVLGEGVLYASGSVDVTAQVLSGLETSYLSGQ